MEEKNFMPICSEKCVHIVQIQQAKKTQPTRIQIRKLADMFKIFADDTRLRIICSILNQELCVCDLCQLLNLNQSAVSHQLQLLRKAKLVKYRREGKQIYYSLEDAHIESIIQMATSHIIEGEK